jgi:O-antigen ligase
VANTSIFPAESAAISTPVSADMIIRSILFVAIFLSVWISFHPFQDLAEPPPELTSGGDLANEVGFSTAFLVLAVWTSLNQPSRLKLILRPALIMMLLWCALSVVTSWEPSLAARRLAFALVLMSISGMALLLPKTLRHFSDLMAAVTLIVLVACYLGVMFAPSLSIHQATDFLEPDHPGNWRGVFPHKNEAGATMVLFIFVGIFVARMRSLGLGALIIVLAAVFLFFTQSKTAMGVLPLALILSAIVARLRSPATAIALVLAVLAIFNLCSVGTVLFEPVREVVESIMPDATFTGRTEIWQVALQAVAQHPITGYGFLAFWGTEQVVYGLGDTTSWVNSAADAHNSYLNLALSIGIPGLALVIVWIVILPILDFFRHPRTIYTLPLQMLFLRVCLFSIYAACFESSLFKAAGEIWFFFMIAAFGFRYLSVTRLTA